MPQLFGKKIVFTSLMPPTASTSACGGGSSYTYQANLARAMVDFRGLHWCPRSPADSMLDLPSG